MGLKLGLAATLVCAVVASNGLAATTVSRSAVASAGGTTAGPQASMRSVVGQMVSGTSYSTHFVLGAGVLNVGAQAAVGVPRINDGGIARLRLYLGGVNPVRFVAAIRYDVPEAGRVRLLIYDALGRVVRRLVDESTSAGRHTVYWGRQDEAGNRVAAGIYFARLVMGSRDEHIKLVVLN